MKILIVDDEPAIAQNVEYALQTEGYETLYVSTGNEAIEQVGLFTPDLIVLDVGLPDKNGFEVCRELRKTSQVPIIFLTARTEEIDRVVGLEMGGDDYVTKPFSPRELAARVKAILRRLKNIPEATKEPASVHKGPFVVNDNKRQIIYFETNLPLSKYEYDILKIFIDRPGQVFSRNQIMDLAWEEPGTSLDRSVDAHIKTLRAKLKAVKDDVDPIQTHRGVGYSLKENL
jgi:two-component system, OmpR family, catabolic regulation response regulator CreB